MKTKLLKKLRRQVNNQYFTRGKEVLMSMHPLSEIDYPFIVIYDCIDEKQAEMMCKMERIQLMDTNVKRLRYEANKLKAKRQSQNEKAVIKQLKKVRRQTI